MKHRAAAITIGLSHMFVLFGQSWCIASASACPVLRQSLKLCCLCLVYFLKKQNVSLNCWQVAFTPNFLANIAIVVFNLGANEANQFWLHCRVQEWNGNSAPFHHGHSLAVGHIQRPTLLDRNPWISFWCIPCILVPASTRVCLVFPTPAASTNISFILKNLSHPSTKCIETSGIRSSPASSLLWGLGPYNDCRSQALVKLFSLFCFLASLRLRRWIAIIVEGCFNTSARHVWKIQDETINMEMQPNPTANMGPQKWERFEHLTCFCFLYFAIWLVKQ